MSTLTDHQIDVDFEQARVLHRVVRAMHDGECPKCHELFDSRRMRPYAGEPSAVLGQGFHPQDLICPTCAFRISKEDQDAAIAAFAPVMDRNLGVFEAWRESRKGV